MGFRKAETKQAALKIGIYGKSGTGKTFTSLLFAEGLVKGTNKRIAYVDTETGTAFYCKHVADRAVHPEAFDFDVLHTRSITEVIREVKRLSPSEYGVVIIDSITHLWEAAKESYTGKLTKAGQPPFHAWAKIKRPYKELITFLLSSPMHVFICGREGNLYEEDEDSGELKMVGTKMKSEGETPYEPHILLQMDQIRNTKDPVAKVRAFVEKDRTGVLSGRAYVNPNFDMMIKPLLSLLGDEQASITTLDEAAAQDAEVLASEELEKAKHSEKLVKAYTARMELADTAEDLWKIGEELTPAVKSKMLTADVAAVRDAFFARQELVGVYKKPKKSKKKPDPQPDPLPNTDTDGYSAHQVKVIVAAKGLYGDEYMSNIKRLAADNQDPFIFETANPMQCNYLLQRIEEEANRP